MKISSYQPPAITPAQAVTPEPASRFAIQDTIEISSESLRTGVNHIFLPPINEPDDV